MIQDDQIKLVKRLVKFASLMRIPACDREDYALTAYTKALEHGQLEWRYVKVCLRNLWFVEKRNRRVRGSSQELHYVDGDETSVELARLFTPPTQEIGLEASQALTSIASLKAALRDVMVLLAMEYTVDEIADRLKLSRSDVIWKVARSRELLRQLGHDNPGGTKRGHSKYIGIRRRRHRWEARIRDKSDGYVYLGNFATASDAARAYDDAARRIRGNAAACNFPTSP